MEERDEQHDQKVRRLVELRARVDKLERELGVHPGADLEASPKVGAEDEGPAGDEACESLMVKERISAMANVARAIAHEINNPLATCMGYLKRAQQIADQIDADELDQVLEALARSAARIQGIVGELQMLSEEFIRERERLDLAWVIDRVGRLIAPEFRARIDFELQAVEVYLDRPRLYQLLYNVIMSHLLSTRLTEQGTRVTVQCGPHRDDEARFTVESDMVPRMGMRTDLLAALRGEDATATIPLRLAHRLAMELGARWQEEPTNESHFRTSVFFEAV